MKATAVIIFALIFLSRQFFAQNESTIISNLFSSSNEITQLSTDLISIGVDAVWGASELAGQVVFTGTISQSQQNLNIWSYSATPNDKMVIIWANGDRLEYVFNTFQGWTQGDEEDFKESHYIDFVVNRSGLINNLHIMSNTYPEQSDEFYIKWNRTIQGEVLDENEMVNVNINHNGQYNKPDLGSGIAIYYYWEEALGQAVSNSRNYSVSEGYWRTIAHNSNAGIFSMSTEIKNNSSVTVNNNVYKYQDADVFWVAYTQFADSAQAGIYNQVTDAHQWIAEGILLKNNQQYGTVQFSEPPVNYTDGPVLICKLNNGSAILLHSLINRYVTDVKKSDEIPISYSLEQNFPNPFNPVTTIRYSIPIDGRREKLNVKLVVYDALGREVAILVNEEKQPGYYEVKWTGSDHSSGIYIYRIQVGDYTEAKKMILNK